MLEQSESLDSDEVRNDDGDEVVAAPEAWINVDNNESLDEKLAAEIPDQPPENRPFKDDDRGDQGEPDMIGDDLDRLEPDVHGRTKGQVSGTPEDGASFFGVPR